MTEVNRQRLYHLTEAMRQPLPRALTIAVAAILVLTPVVIFVLGRMGKLGEKNREELMKRYHSWLVLTPLMILPVLLGAVWTILAAGVLSLLCYREFARA